MSKANFQDRNRGLTYTSETSVNFRDWSGNYILINVKFQDCPESNIRDCRGLLKKNHGSSEVNFDFGGRSDLSRRIVHKRVQVFHHRDYEFSTRRLDSLKQKKLQRPMLIELEEFRERDSGFAGEDQASCSVNIGINLYAGGLPVKLLEC
ncbi:hypothetical protein JTB14_034440 [Gonioctena quinquepunctata]|nr:hypothetical protein JTB14_034440 [Gonioctena quinquepunctata]